MTLIVFLILGFSNTRRAFKGEENRIDACNYEGNVPKCIASDILTSLNRKYSAYITREGCFAVSEKDTKKEIWSTCSQGGQTDKNVCAANKTVLTLQDDGVATLKGCANQIMWKTKVPDQTSESPFRLVLENDGQVIIRDSNQNIIWTTAHPTIRLYETNKDDAGAGSIFYLDRHKIACEQNEAISGFQLMRMSTNIFYKVKCLNSKLITNECEDKTTSLNNIGADEKASVHFLDRHTLECGNYAIRSFKLGVNEKKKIFYSYKCCKMSPELKNPTCKNDSTSLATMGNRGSFYLDRHDVSAGVTSVLTKLHLISTGDQIKYEFRSCSVLQKQRKKFRKF